jgi:hypothetical protein
MATGSTIRIRFPARSFLFSIKSRVPLEPILGFAFALNLPEREANTSPPSGAEIKNPWILTSTPFLCLHILFICDVFNVSRSGKLLLPLARTAILGSGSRGSHYDIFLYHDSVTVFNVPLINPVYTSVE